MPDLTDGLFLAGPVDANKPLVFISRDIGKVKHSTKATTISFQQKRRLRMLTDLEWCRLDEGSFRLWFGFRIGRPLPNASSEGTAVFKSDDLRVGSITENLILAFKFGNTALQDIDSGFQILIHLSRIAIVNMDRTTIIHNAPL